MTDNEALLKKAEGVAGFRRILLIINALGYFTWIGATGLERGHVAIDGGTLKLVQVIAGAIWLVSLVTLFIAMAQLRRRKDIAGLVDDERTQGLTARCFQMGYWALILGVTAVYTASYLMDVDVKLIAPFLLALGVAVPPLTFAFLYRS